MAQLIFKYGTMSSAKTCSLLTFCYNLEERGLKFLCLKPDIDTRDGEGVIKSRIKGLERDCLTIYNDSNLFESINNLFLETKAKIDYVLIDESQFLTVNHVNELSCIVDMLDINVICFGLRTDFKSFLFPASKRLFEIADKIEEIESICHCGNKTMFNARFDDNNEIVLDGEQIEIGGDDRYIALCRKCYYEKINN